MKEAKEVIELLINNLPDSDADKEQDWEWCWDALSCDSQDDVKKARRVAKDFLKSL